MTSYDAFISYSHEADGDLAPQLQQGLERLGKPWWRRSPFITVFRDETSFGAASDLEGGIGQALDESSHLIMLLSPASAASPWVNEEAKHWIATKGVESMSFVVTTWGAPDAGLGTFDWNGTDVPPALRGKLAEPLAIDLRWAAGAASLTLADPQFEDNIAMLAAAVKGVNKDQLVGEMVAMRARARILTGSLILAAVILLGAIVVAGAGWLLARNQQASAEAAAAQADQDRSAAEALRDEANTAAEDAQQLQQDAEAAAGQAESLRLEAERARTAAEAAADAAQAAEEEATAAAALAADDRDDALAAQVDAEDKATEAATAQAVAESAATAAEVARGAAEDATSTAVALQVEAEAAAEEATLIATSRRLAGQALARMSGDLDLASLLAVEAYGIWPTAQARNAILTSLQTSPDLRLMLHDINVDGPDSVAVSPNGDRVVAASGDGNSLLIWDGPEYGPPKIVDGVFDIEARSEGIAFGATDDVVAFGRFAGGQILLYDLAARDILPDFGAKILNGANADVAVVGSIDPNDAGLLGTLANPQAIGFVAAVNSFGLETPKVHVWTITESCLTSAEECTSRLFDAGTEASANIAELSPDGTMIATRWQDDGVRVWDVFSGTEVVTLVTGPPNDGAATFDPESKLLAVASGDGLQLWDIATGLPDGPVLPLGDANISNISISPDGTMIAAGNADSELWIWDLTTDALVGAVKTMPDGPVSSVGFAADGRSVWASSGDSTIYRWNLFAGPVAGTAFDVDREAVAFALSPNGSMVAVSARGSTPGYGFEVRDALTGEVLRSSPSAHPSPVIGLEFSPDGAILASASQYGPIRFWDVASLSPLGSPIFDGAPADLNGIAFDPAGQGPSTRFASSAIETVKLWDVATQQETAAFSPGVEFPTVRAVAISPDGSTLAGVVHPYIQLWDLSTGQTMGNLLQAGFSVTSVTFTPDGSRVAASTSSDSTIFVWDVESQQLVYRFVVPGSASAWDLAFSPDGTLGAGAAGQVADDTLFGQVFLWDAASGQSVGLPFAAHDGPTLDIAFGPDGSALYSLGGGTLLRSDMRTTTWIDLACKRVNRNLTEDEWAVFLPGEEYSPTCR